MTALRALTALILLAAGTPAQAGEPASSQRAGAQTDAAIPAEEFTYSPFADFFKAGDSPQALKALEVLAARYPRDPLILRYQAIVLDRLGRYDDALALYEQLLARNPNHVPTRFFRAQTYDRHGKREQAIAEWKWIKDNSPSKEYRVWPEEELRRLGVRAERRPNHEPSRTVIRL